MRKILLASAALMFTAGAALAQTSQSAPAPTGAINAPMQSPAPNAAAGKMAPDDRTTNESSMAPADKTGSSMSSNAPAPQGATNAPVETSGAGSSPGKTAPDATPIASQPNNSGTNQAMNTPATPTHHWTHHSQESTLPADADAGTYLHIARQAIAHHNKARADDALSHAETVLLNRAVPQTDTNPVDNNPAVTAIENARAALRSGDMSTAARDTSAAWHQVQVEE